MSAYLEGRDRHQQIGAEEEVAGISRFAGKVQLGRQHRPARRLHLDVIMPGARAVVPRYDGLKGIAALRVGVLVTPQPEAAVVIAPLGIGVSKIDKRVRDRRAASAFA
jgi:hypothetical protein